MAAPASPARIRADAARIVAQVADQGRSLDDLLAQETDEGSARGLKRALAYGTLRWHLRLLAILRELTSRPPESMPPPLRALALVGLYQLDADEVPPHAAVAETVEAARELGFPKAAAMVNAVLRRFLREREALAGRIGSDLAARTAHPGWLVEALRHDWPTQVEAILEANNQRPPLWLRVNRMRQQRDQYAERLAAAGFKAFPHAEAPDALRVEPATDVKSLPGFDAGDVSVQDAAAQLAIELLAPMPGERLLDACAAPGGKTTHMLERVGDRADVSALDISPARLRRVRENLDRLGLHARLVEGDAGAPQAWWDGQPFDRILLDVPCSATGVIRRHPDIKLLRRPSDIAAFAGRQAAMLEAAWPLVQPGGVLLYTSCSVLREENERVVGRFLEARSDARDQTPWKRPETTGPGFQVLPGEHAMDGFYYACLGKLKA
jgi:16S rRNA (cytosine967-C5)-methyltransferase